MKIALILVLFSHYGATSTVVGYYDTVSECETNAAQLLVQVENRKYKTEYACLPTRTAE